MRPVTKWMPGNHLVVENGQNRTITVPVDYTSYNPDPNDGKCQFKFQYAKRPLIHNLGMFCSYCECAYQQARDIDVEHVQAKKYKDASGQLIYAHLENRWSNFLLGCKTCNGKDNKDSKNVELGLCHLPHLNNTYLSLEYLAGGVVCVNHNLSGDSLKHAQTLYELVRLDKTPLTSNKGDTRWWKRKTDWELANKYLIKYNNKTIDIDTIIDLVKNRGGWSIWFTIFYKEKDVREALVTQIAGTSRNCFDKDFLPIPRNPGDSSDPI